MVNTSTANNDIIHLRFPDIGLDRRWSTHELLWELFPVLDLDLRCTEPKPEQIKALRAHTQETSPLIAADVRRTREAAASAFLYLYLSLYDRRESGGCTYTLRSEIPVGAGLGSSSGMAVCISTALLIQTGRLPHPDLGFPLPDYSHEVSQINQCAFMGEIFVHGSPSGIDNTISCGGKAVRFKRDIPSGEISVQILHEFPKLPILLINTRQPRSTNAEVAKVRGLKAKYPFIIGKILESIDEVAELASSILTTAQFDGSGSRTLEQLGKLFRINHGLLASLGISHPKLERILKLVDGEDIGWTKLTGAGGGGCAIAILRPDIQQERIHQLQKELDAEGFEPYQVTIGGDGAGVIPWTNCLSCSEEFNSGDGSGDVFMNARTSELGNVIEDQARLQGEQWRFWAI